MFPLKDVQISTVRERMKATGLNRYLYKETNKG